MDDTEEDEATLTNVQNGNTIQHLLKANEDLQSTVKALLNVIQTDRSNGTHIQQNEKQHTEAVKGLHFDKFNDTLEDFESYTERLTEYFKLQGVPAEKQVGCFIALIGCKYYNLLKNLIYPLTYNDKSFQEIVHILKKHLNPAPPLILSRHIFINRKQQAEETVSEYITHLRKLVIPCRYEGEMLNSMLRDVFVSGLISKPILDRLFEEDDI